MTEAKREIRPALEQVFCFCERRAESLLPDAGDPLRRILHRLGLFRPLPESRSPGTRKLADVLLSGLSLHAGHLDGRMEKLNKFTVPAGQKLRYGFPHLSIAIPPPPPPRLAFSSSSLRREYDSEVLAFSVSLVEVWAAKGGGGGGGLN